MALPTVFNDRWHDALVLDSNGNVALRVFQPIAGGAGVLPASINDRIYQAFGLDGSGNVVMNVTGIGGGSGGVTSIIAGSGISVNQATGAVTITNTGAGSGPAGVTTQYQKNTSGSFAGASLFDSATNYLTLRPSSYLTQNGPFGFRISESTNLTLSRRDDVIAIGWNLNDEVAGIGGIGFGIESFYETNVGIHQKEMYWMMNNGVSAGTRPFAVYFDVDVNQTSVQINATALGINSFDANTSIASFSVGSMSLASGVILASSTPTGTDWLKQGGTSLIRMGSAAVEVAPSSDVSIGPAGDINVVTLHGTIKAPVSGGILVGTKYAFEWGGGTDNHLKLTGNTSGNTPRLDVIAATDTNVDLQIQLPGTGKVIIPNAGLVFASETTGVSRLSSGVIGLTGTEIRVVGDFTVTGSPKFSAITGSTQCLHVNTSGLVTGTGSDCGGGANTALSNLSSVAINVVLKGTNGTTSAPAYSFTSDATMGLWYSNISSVPRLQMSIPAGGLFEVVQSGTGAGGGVFNVNIGSGLVSVSGALHFGFSTGDGFLDSPENNVTAVMHGTTAQEFRVYGTTTGPKYFSLTHDGTNPILGSSSGALKVNSTAITPASTGVRYLCINTNGVVASQATACVGT